MVIISLLYSHDDADNTKPNLGLSINNKVKPSNFTIMEQTMNGLWNWHSLTGTQANGFIKHPQTDRLSLILLKQKPQMHTFIWFTNLHQVTRVNI